MVDCINITFLEHRRSFINNKQDRSGRMTCVLVSVCDGLVADSVWCDFRWKP